MTNYLQLITAAYLFNLKFPDGFTDVFRLMEIIRVPLYFDKNQSYNKLVSQWKESYGSCKQFGYSHNENKKNIIRLFIDHLSEYNCFQTDKSFNT